MNQAIYLGRHGPSAPHMRISRRWPLVGLVGAIAWRYDGIRIVMRLVYRNISSRKYNERARSRRAMVRR